MASCGQSKKKYTPRPRTQPLRRGKACLNCRYLKIKCDGSKPVCGPCARLPKDDLCEYTDGPSRTQELQAAIHRLQVRLEELEGSPSSSGSTPSSSSPTEHFMSATSSVPISSPFSGSSAESESTFLGMEEPPMPMTQMLIDNFLPHAPIFGFFLHPDRFRASALLPLPLGDPQRPSPALLAAVYLWGVHISHSQPLLQYELVFLRRALHYTATEIGLGATTAHLVHTIQAEVLLATYFFQNNKPLEAEFHTNGAVSLALACDLHKLHSVRSGRSVVGMYHCNPAAEVFPRPPLDAIEDGERINAFWSVFCLQKHLMVSGSRISNHFGGLEAPGADIDTPWPRDMVGYEAVHLLPISGDATINSFLQDLPAVNVVPSQFAAVSNYTKATVMFSRAVYLVSRWKPEMAGDEFNAYRKSCAALDMLAVAFAASLPPPDHLNAFNMPTPTPSSSNSRLLVLTHALAAATSMKLHSVFSFSNVDSALKSVCAAQTTIRLLSDLTVPDAMMVHPIVGTVMLFACEVLAAEMANFRTFGDEGVLRAAITNAMTALVMLAVDSPFINYQLAKVQNLATMM